jgi:hypothetical protein
MWFCGWSVFVIAAQRDRDGVSGSHGYPVLRNRYSCSLWYPRPASRHVGGLVLFLPPLRWCQRHTRSLHKHPPASVGGGRENQRI